MVTIPKSNVETVIAIWRAPTVDPTVTCILALDRSSNIGRVARQEAVEDEGTQLQVSLVPAYFEYM